MVLLFLSLLLFKRAFWFQPFRMGDKLYRRRIFDRINSATGVNKSTFILSILTVEQLTKNRKQNV